MGVRWARRDPWERESMLANNETLRVIERRAQSYAGFGWVVVERQETQARVRIRYPVRRRGTLPRAQDAGDRIIWVDDAGEAPVTKADA